MTAEHQRLIEAREKTKDWKKWGPYLSERQWGTVREDYSAHGAAWEYVPFDHAHSKAYRWGEDGIGGISDDKQRFCMAWAFWNGKDPIFKERLFGLTGPQGNHAEDVKELYYYLDSSPTHSYMQMLYKYPQNEFPYKKLLEENLKRSKKDLEYELIDTGIFDNDEYFDIFISYAKEGPEDIVAEVKICNRARHEAKIWAMPTFWFRRNWFIGDEPFIPQFSENDDHILKASLPDMGNYFIEFEGSPDIRFCDNETNKKRLYGVDYKRPFFKDGIHEFLIHGNESAVNPKKKGTKAAAIYELTIPAQGEAIIRYRMSHSIQKQDVSEAAEILEKRKRETDEFYEVLQERVKNPDHRLIQRQAYAGMLWTKQFYYYNVKRWIEGDPEVVYEPPKERRKGRNKGWTHMYNQDILSMPDKWEYPWYAVWDTAFHCIPLCRLDPDFAKQQLTIFLNESYMHPNGQIPAYEWNFSDVNPPVHAYAVQRVYQIDKKMNDGVGDQEFLEKCFHKLMINFTWWVNQKDSEGKNIFEGGFLGLDNISVIDRSHAHKYKGKLEQADATSWMAMFSLNMLRISLDLCEFNKTYQYTASKFLEHFLHIAGAMNNISGESISLWDEKEQFYFDIFHLPGKPAKVMKLKSVVGLIPLFAVESIKIEKFEDLPDFKERLDFFLKERPELAALVSSWIKPGHESRRLFALLKWPRMKNILKKTLDSSEFLSDYGIRSMSKYHEKHPFSIKLYGETLTVRYIPGESDTRMFGGNSNWRGPIWFPINHLLIESLRKFDYYYGGEMSVEYPTGSGKQITLDILARELSLRLIKLFERDEDGNRPIFGGHEKMNTDPHFKDHILFYEYFHGDNGRGLGASHQTGWTGLVAEMIHKYHKPRN